MTHQRSFTSNSDEVFNCSGSSPSTTNSSMSTGCFISSPGSSSYNHSGPPDVYTYQTAKAAAESMPKILENGRKVFGPPANWAGPRPSYICELFVTRIPQHLDEMWFLIWLHRFGTVYEFRLMMDSANTNRGYAFIRFSKESEAIAAYELLSFHYQTAERLLAFRSLGKNRLYVSNIPKMLPVDIVREGFKKIFPQLENIRAYESKMANRGMSPYSEEQNRGYAFIQFFNHEEALEAKKRTTPGRVRMWNSDLKIQWAKPKQETKARAVDPSEVKYKGNLRRTLFNAGKGNEKCLPKYRLIDEYNEKLRLICLANDWCIPIVLYGRNFRQFGIQYGAILLKSDITGESSCIIMEVDVHDVVDIHQLMSEVVVLLTENEAGFPHDNYLLRVKQNQAEIVLLFRSPLTSAERFHSTDYYFHNSDSINELAETLDLLTRYTSKELLDRYKSSLLTTNELPILHLDSQQQIKSKICAILPKFRNNQPLEANINDSEINLMLKSATAESTSNVFTAQATACAYNSRPLRQMMPKQIMRLKSQRIQRNNQYVLRYVDATQGNQFYHPAQKININPVWISGHTYQQSFFN